MDLREVLEQAARDEGLRDDQIDQAFTTAAAIVLAMEKMELAFAAFRGLLPPQRVSVVLEAVARRALEAAEGKETTLTDYLLKLVVLAQTTVSVYEDSHEEFVAAQAAAEASGEAEQS
jgi:hypothetical protein